MSTHVLKNQELTLKFNSLGAELSSITDNTTQIDYLWSGDPTYWKRHSPILFPIVGSLKNHQYTYQGKTYTMSQHGFARDMEFIIKSESANELWFELTANQDTLLAYPFNFILEVGYILNHRTLTVCWKVMNKDTDHMYFSIGAHPAFMCPLGGNGKQSDYYISFDCKDDIPYYLVNANGLAITDQLGEQKYLTTNTINNGDNNSILAISSDLFDHDALIIENNKCHKVSLLTPDKKPYITVDFDAPLFGLWSPPKKDAPFICIEPWYGRCDAVNFTGDLEDREWSNSLKPSEEFTASYTIEIGNVELL